MEVAPKTVQGTTRINNSEGFVSKTLPGPTKTDTFDMFLAPKPHKDQLKQGILIVSGSKTLQGPVETGNFDGFHTNKLRNTTIVITIIRI